MNLKTVPRTAVTTYIKVVRWPIDRVLGRDAKLVVDRAEASARDVAGTVLGDEQLQRDAEKRRVVADEREKAAKLRAEAQTRRQQATRKANERKAKAEQERTQATRDAKAKQDKAKRERDAATKRATDAEAKRKEATEKAAAAKQEAIDDKAKRDRLEQLDRETGVVKEKEEALTSSDEAARLREAAGQAKAARKSS